MRCVLFSAVLLTTSVLCGCGSTSRTTDPTKQAGLSNNSSQPTTAGEIAHDFSTPEGAILSLEDAYRAQDVEAAVRCKEFTVEATLMLQQLQGELAHDQEIIAKTAEVLELAFRSEMQTQGFPDFRDVTSTFSSKRPFHHREDLVEITETCARPDGSTVTNKLLAAKTPTGWKVVTLPE